MNGKKCTQVKLRRWLTLLNVILLKNLLVAYNFKSDIARITEAFPDAVVLDKDPETINKWNRGEIKMLLAHPASASAGLNLQAGGSVLVWFGLPWSLEYYQQFNGRLHRQGQTKPCACYSYNYRRHD